MKTIKKIMSVDSLMKYREFDRNKIQKPYLWGLPSYNMNEITDYIKITGINKDNAPELSVYKNKILLTDGNHRLLAASNLGYRNVPIEVNFYESKEELEKSFYPHTIKRFKKNTDFKFKY